LDELVRETRAEEGDSGTLSVTHGEALLQIAGLRGTHAQARNLASRTGAKSSCAKPIR
jgi:hypothetical protein